MNIVREGRETRGLDPSGRLLVAGVVAVCTLCFLVGLLSGLLL
jgi:hypothetical protein